MSVAPLPNSVSTSSPLATAPSEMPSRQTTGNARPKTFFGALQVVASRPAFIAAFAVLFVAAMGLNAATQYMRLYFKKEAVPLRRELDLVPPTLGPWVQVSVDKALDPEMQDVLGTTKYIFRDYVDSRLVNAREIADFKNMTEQDAAMAMARIRRDQPAAVLRAAVTYYTGSVDTVAHIPDRCYVADGFEPDTYTTPTWNLGPDLNSGKPLEVRFINFEDTSKSRGNQTHNVAYFFSCNGDYVSDPLLGVRVRLQSLTERHGYYAKVELMNEMTDRARASDVLRDFTRSALPEFEKCFPDWKAVKAAE